MAQSKLGFKLLSICGLTLGLMAVGGASLAQAEPGAYWGYLVGTELLKFGVN
jgi:hypothetical protein